MTDFTSSLFANAYYGFSPAANIATAICKINGQVTACPDLTVFKGAMLGFALAISIIALALCVLIITSVWKVFKKAGQPGWASIIPIYNYIVMLRIIRKPVWWVILFFIPFVNAIISIILVYHIAKAFGKGVGFTIGLILLPFIFYPILGFGKSVYTPPQA